MTQSLVEQLAALKQTVDAALVEQLLGDGTDEQWERLRWDWRVWGRPEQFLPPDPWTIWLVLAGRGAGKTRQGAESVREIVATGEVEHVGLIAKTPADARDVMIEGPAGILAVTPHAERPTWEPSKRRLTWPNGCSASVFSGENPDQARGPQHQLIWADEVCFIAGTMVLKGDRTATPIEEIVVGDEVMTRCGPRRVRESRPTSMSQVFKVTTEGGRTITGTAEHPVMANGRWTPIASLLHGDTLVTWTSSSGTTELGTETGATATTATEPASCCTEPSGRESEGQSRSGRTSTMSMKTEATTGSKTSSASRRRSTSDCMDRGGSSRPPLSSTHDGLDGSGPRGRPARRCVNIAVEGLPAVQPVFGSAPRVAGLQPARRRGSTTSSGTVVAAPRSPSIDSRQPRLVADRVLSVRPMPGVAQTFNLSIESEHEFFANGILVHNCAYQYPEETWDNLAFGLRLPWKNGGAAKAIITTTPRPIKALRQIMALKGCIVTRGNTYQNRSNLDAGFLQQMLDRYEGTRLGRQELMAELLEDVVGAMWSREQIDGGRRPYPGADFFERVVVAIDPAVSTGDESCETGIVVAARGEDKHLYVLADRSCRLSPHGWASRAVEAAEEFGADCILAEANNGGDMVSHTVRTAHPKAKVKLVHASRGKRTRAEPVSALYEQDRVHHVGTFPQLEDQLCSFTGVTSGETSPDRLDALVWALSDLSAPTRPRFTMA